MNMFLSIDIGGTKTSIGVFDSQDNPRLLSKLTIPTLFDCEQHFKEISKQLSSIVKMSEIKKVTICLPGVLNSDKTKIEVSSNLVNWQGINLIVLSEKYISTNVMIVEDSYCAALGELVYGKHKEESFVYIVWGTGVGGAFVSIINKGVVIESIELGFQIISEKKGFEFLESNTGGNAIEQKYKNSPQNLTEEQWSEVLDSMASGVYNLKILKSVDTIVFGGGLISKQSAKLEILKSKLAKKCEFLQITPPRIVLSNLGEDSGLFGGLALWNV